MKKIFYFSKPSLKYVEIKHFKLKLFSVLFISALLFALIFMVFYYYIDLGTNTSTTIYTLKRENRELKKEIERIGTSYKSKEYVSRDGYGLLSD